MVLLAGLLALSCSSVWGQDLSFRALHYWDQYDLSDSTLYRPVGGIAGEDSFSAMETEAANFFALLKNVPDSVARIAVGNYLDRAALASRDGFDAYGQILGIAEKYFYNVQSPYYCEEMLLPFLDHKIARADIPEVEKSREKYLAMIIRRNSVGSKAEDFKLYEISGKGAGKNTATLYEFLGQLTERQSLMIVFFTDGCRDCIDGIARLKHSPAVRNMISEGYLAVLAVCTQGQLSNVKARIPDSWTVADDGGYLFQNSLYSTRQIPSVYFLERDGVVLLKDASVSSAIQFLLEHFEYEIVSGVPFFGPLGTVAWDFFLNLRTEENLLYLTL